MDKETENIETTNQTESTSDKTELTPQEQFGEKMDEILSPKSDDKKDKNNNKQVQDESTDENIDSQDDEIVESNENQETTEIDSEVLEVLNDYGLKQETIDKILEESPQLIAAIKEELNLEKKNDKPVDKKPANTDTKNQYKELKLDVDPDLIDEKLKTSLDEIVKRINEQGKVLESESQKLKQERENAYQNRIDSHFDRLEKTLPIVGNSSKLTENQYQQRIRIFRHALVTSEIDNIPVEKAIEIEINKIKNQDSEKVAGQKILDKLENQKKHFIHKPTRRHSEISSMKFDSDQERKEAIMAEAYKAANIAE
jgi:hypothetical protein